MLFTIRRRSIIPAARGKDLHPRSSSTSRRMSICLFPGSRVTTDQRVVAKQGIQEVESAKRAGATHKQTERRPRIVVDVMALNTYMLCARRRSAASSVRE